MRWATLAVLAAGCAADPCGSFGAQTCVMLDVRWSGASRLVDQLAVRGLEGFTLDARTPSPAGDAFELPALIPIALGGFQGAFRVAVRALRSDGEVGAGELSAEILRGAHRRHRVELRAPDDLADLSGIDSGAVDLAREADLFGAGSFMVTASKTAVLENERFLLRLTALGADGAVLRSYSGTPSFGTNWGDLRVHAPPTFFDGEGDATVSLNRETNLDVLSAYITVSDGERRGRSPNLTVAAPLWMIDPTTAIFGLGSGWDGTAIDRPSWTRAEGVYYLTYRGRNTFNTYDWGTATSLDGAAWNRPLAGTIEPSTTGWDNGQPIETWMMAWDGFRFAAVYNAGQGVGWAVSGDGSVWSRRPTEVPIGTSASCPDAPLARALTVGDGRLHIYLEAPQGPCEIFTNDVGTSWSASRPTMGLATAAPSVVAASLRDRSVHRLWYRVTDGSNTTGYATSSDGINWVQSPSAPSVVRLETVLWNEVLERYEALYVGGQGFFRVTRP